MLAVTFITFFVFVADVKCGLCLINKNNSKCYTWTESGPKNVPRPNRSDVGLERARSRTWTCTNTNNLVLDKEQCCCGAG